MAENSDWETIRRQHHYRCIICRQPEKVAGRLVEVQITEQSGNGTHSVPMCPAHHLKYTQGYFTNAELKKIGMSREAYLKNVSASTDTAEPGLPKSTAEKAILAQQEAIKKVQKAQKKRFQQIQSDYKKEI
jgi:hypothetical protein